MSKLISLADYEVSTRNLGNGQRLQQISMPLKNFAPTLKGSQELVPEIMRAMGVYQADLCMKIAWRARDLGRQLRASMGRSNDDVIEVNPAVVSVDFAVVWAFRAFDLEAMHRADNLTFIAEYTKIQQSIKREPPFFPRDVRLRFARNGARDNPA